MPDLVVAGNWKMNTTVAEAVALAAAVRDGAASASGVELVLCPPFVSLAAVSDAVKGSAVKVGAQNMHFEDSGAFTGEVSPGMLQDFCKKPLDVSDIPWGSQFHVSFFEHERDKTEMKSLRSDNTNVVAGSCHYGPNTLVTWIKFTETNLLHQYFFEAPIDHNHTRIFCSRMGVPLIKQPTQSVQCNCCFSRPC